MTCPLTQNGYCETRKIWCSTIYCGKCWRKMHPGEPKPELPSVPQMAANFTVATARHLLNGMKERTAEQQEGCLKLCRECNQMILKNEQMRCTNVKCGCVLERKVKWESAHCPVKKW